MIRIVPLLRRIAASLLLLSIAPCGAAVVEASYNSAADLPVTAATYSAAGNTVNLSLNFAPPTGTTLTVVKTTGVGFIAGRFDNLTHGQRIELPFNGIRYPFVANYYGGDGNDLVLEWANTRLMVWGYNGNGQLGLGNTSTAQIPVALPLTGALAGKTILQLGVGTNHNLALCSDGSLAAWGAGSSGQLGHNSMVESQVPVAVDQSGVLAGKRVISIATAGSYNLALCSDGSLAFWGANDAGVAGNGTWLNKIQAPSAVDQNGVLAGKSVVAITASEFSCWALCSDGTIAGWGSNGAGQLGDGTTSNQLVPAKILMTGALAGKTPVAIAAGGSQLLVLCSDGALATWGNNQYGQLGNNSTDTFSTTPVAVVRTGVLSGKTITGLTSGGTHAMVLCSDSTVASWGQNQSGQLGNNSVILSRVPVAVVRTGALSGKTITKVICGDDHNLALCSDGTLTSWGEDFSGQLGSDNSGLVPGLVTSTGLQAGERFYKMATGSSAAHSVALVAMPPPPVLLTQAADPVSDQRATLRGTASANGTATALNFEYGPSAGLGRTLAAVPANLSGSTDTPVSAELSGLTPGSTWFYRLRGTSTGGTVAGETLSFTTGTAAALSALSTPAGALSPAFQTPVASYRITVSSDTSGISFTPTVAQAGATVTVGGSPVASGTTSPLQTLVPGNNAIPVTVSSADGTINFTYTVQVTRVPETFVFSSAADQPLTSSGFDLSGKQAGFSLQHLPMPGSSLTVLKNTGVEFLKGSFTNLAQGQLVPLTYQGITYTYVADYFGGSGNNDLVLRWANARAVGWGSNNYGELGFANPTQATSALPVTSSGDLAGRTLIATAACNNFSLALDRDGQVYAWGQNQYGQLGTGDNTLSTVPKKVISTGALAGKRVIALSGSFNHSLALCSDGSLFAWGYNQSGQLGNGSTTNSNVPVAVDMTGVLAGKTVVQISSDGDFNLALCSDGTLAAWGQNGWGQLGDGSTTNRNRPVAVLQDGYLRDRSVTQIAAGTGFSLALLADGSIAGWGRNDGAHLGDGTLVSTKVPGVAGKGGSLTGKTVIAISASLTQGLALCSDGTIGAWGSNGSGELGNNGNTNSTPISAPVAVVRTGVLAGKTVTGISAGFNFSLASCSDGTVAAWGFNQRGELGNGTTSFNSTVPVLQNPATAYPGNAFAAIGPDAAGTHSLTLLAAPPGPLAETLAVTALRDTGATLNAEVRPNGTNTTISFEYGLSTSYGSAVPASPASASGSGASTVSAVLNGLLGGSTYHYRVIAVNANGEIRGADGTFTTTTAAALVSLSAGGHALAPAFSPEIPTYAVTVPNTAASIVVDPRAASPTAAVTVNGNPAAPGGNVVALAEGSNNIAIVVTAADGINSRNYTLTVFRMPGTLGLSSAAQAPLAVGQLDATGQTIALELLFNPNAGANLPVISVPGWEPIRGRFANLAQGQQVSLSFGGVTYNFVANYYGGDGNDLVLHWANSRMFGWGGTNATGALGILPSETVTIPTPADATPLLNGKTILSIAAGRAHTAALLSDGTVLSWGSNNRGQLGTNSVANFTSIATPADTSGVLAGKTVTAIAAGEDFTLALCSDGTLTGWGLNDLGQLGNGDSTQTTSKVPLNVTQVGALNGRRVIAIAAGGAHSMALCTDGSIAAWGNNQYGQLGNGLTTSTATPQLVDRSGVFAGKTITKISAGSFHSLALCSDGSLMSWGRNNSSQLGDGSTTTRLLPVAVLPGVLSGNGKTPVSIAAGGTHNLVLCQDGTLASWGFNLRGQLGDGSTSNRNAPVAVSTSDALAGKTVTSFAAGLNHSLAITSDGTALSWGYDINGQRGDGTAINNPALPAAVSTTNLKAGERFTLLSACPAFDLSLALLASPPPPQAITLEPSLIGDTGVVFAGTIRANGSTVNCRFEFGRTIAYGSITGATPTTASGTGDTAISHNIGALIPGTTYHYRAFAEGPGGITYGEDRTFTTTTLGTLSGLAVSQGALSPSFERTRTTYQVTVPADVTTITVTPQASSPTAAITVNNVPLASGSASAPLPLQNGDNAISITVTAADGVNTSDYLVLVLRMPAAINFAAADTIPFSYFGFSAVGNLSNLSLGHAPQVGAGLRIVDNLGTDPIIGRFDNLAQGQRVLLEFGGITYTFIANYYGGTGNDLVLEWGNTRLFGWGNNTNGQVGAGPVTTQLWVPTAVDVSGVFGGVAVQRLTVGGGHALVQSMDGKLFSWGANDFYQVGDGTTLSRNTPIAIPYQGVLVGKTIIATACGYTHNLALCSDGSLAAWGSNNAGQLGNGTTTNSPVPVAVNLSGVLNGKRITRIACGYTSSYALCDDGTIAAWGKNAMGQLGTGSTTPSSSSTPVAVLSSGVLNGRFPVMIAAGQEFAVVVCSDDSIAAWGTNNDGQLGDNTTTQRSAPVLVNRTGVLAGKSVVQLVTGGSHVLVRLNDGSLAGWGDNGAGNLGDSSTTDRTAPVLTNRSGILNGKTITAIDAAGRFSLALCSDGSLAAWGSNSNSELGDNSTTSRNSPVLVNTSTIHSAERFVLARAADVGTSYALVASPPAPIAATLAASAIADDSALLNASVAPNGQTSTVSFEFGTTPSFGTSLAPTPATLSGTGTQASSRAVAGLIPGTTYFYRIVASSPGGIARGEIRSFTTTTKATLASLTSSEGPVAPDFDSRATDYFLSVPFSVQAIAFTPVAANPGTTLTVAGNPATSGQASAPIALSPGQNAISIVSTSADAAATLTYRVMVTRLPEFLSFASATEVPLQVNGLVAAGNLNINLAFAPPVGTNLTVVDNRGRGFIRGSFANLTQGQLLRLDYNGITYEFIADYHGGDGNDLVLQWANVKPFAWGRNDSGQVGNRKQGSNSNTPVAVVDANGVFTAKTIIRIATGASHTLALCSDGTLAAWGSNNSGKLGSLSTFPSYVPVLVQPGELAGKTVIAIAAGAEHSLALCSDGSIAAWGSNSLGQLGAWEGKTSATPRLLEKRGSFTGKHVVRIATGDSFNLALCDDGTLHAWGANNNGQLGDGSTDNRLIPVQVGNDSVLASRKINAMAAGASHAAAIAEDGSLFTWGFNQSGQLGDNTTFNRSRPGTITTSGIVAGKQFAAVACGATHTLALTTDNLLSAWGNNNAGSLGNGTTTSSNVPVAVTQTGVVAGKTIRNIIAGINTSFAYCSDGTTTAWGAGGYGALGTANATGSNVPVITGTSGQINAGEKLIFLSGSAAASHIGAIIAAPPRPSVATLAAQVQGDTGAILNGTLRANAANASAWFEYGLSTDYGQRADALPAPVNAGSSAAVSTTLANLSGGATYHYRAVASSATGISYGEDRTFTTGNAAALATLDLTGIPLSPAFHPQLTAYFVTVPSATANVQVNASAQDPAALVQVGEATPTAGSATVTVNLAPGTNTIPVLVTGAGSASRGYEVKLLRFPSALTWTSGQEKQLNLDSFVASGPAPSFTLGFAPTPGTSLTIAERTGFAPFTGRFEGLAQGQEVFLTFNGVSYRFIANYYGGDGNDLVLEWANRRLVGWGKNTGGELGHPEMIVQTLPVATNADAFPASGTIFAVDSCGTGNHTLALASDGTVYGWGANNSGQLGNGSTTNAVVPTPVDRSGILAGKRVVKIAAGTNHSLALCEDGTLAAWGRNDGGQLGTGDNVNQLLPVAVDQSGVLAGKHIIAIAAGEYASYAACSDGTVAAWGGNGNGALGFGLSEGSFSTPLAVDRTGILKDKIVIELSAGEHHCLSVCSDGTLAGWGYNSYGSLGDGSSTDSATPIPMNTGALAGKKVIHAAAARAHSIAVCSDGTVAACGRNNFGEVGDNTPSTIYTPVAITSNGALAGRSVIDVDASMTTGLALLADGGAAVWGDNAAGQFGNGTRVSSGLPTAVLPGAIQPGELMIAATSANGFSFALLASPPAPSVETLAAAPLADTGATLNAQVSANGSDTAISFEYGLTTTYGSTLGATPATATGTAATSASALIADLLPGTTYHYRAIGRSAGGTIRGADRTFTTTTLSALSGLTLSQGSIYPAFATPQLRYTATVAFPVAELTLSPVTATPGSVVTINGGTSTTIPLVLGANTISIQVQGPGAAPLTYTLTVTRLPESFTFGSAADIALTATDLDLTGLSAPVVLNFDPAPGSSLVLLKNTSTEFIHGQFTNLPHGSIIALQRGDLTYEFVANYYGGDGNDLVLQWARTRLFGWGRNDDAQLGEGAASPALIPTPLAISELLPDTPILALAAGHRHSLALAADGNIYAWGRDSSGQLGQEGRANSALPLQVDRSGVLAGRSVVALAAGYEHSLALCSDGRIAAWGWNGSGQLGVSGYVDSYVPVLVENTGALKGKTVVKIAAGYAHNLALCSDGTIVGWGDNQSGQLGTGNTKIAPTPVLVSTDGALKGKRVVEIATGDTHSLALCSDGTLAAWGKNESGQLGLGNTETPKLTPVALPLTGPLASKTVISLSANYLHSLALCSDGSMFSWGSGSSGRLGDGFTTQRNSPIQVTTAGVLSGKPVAAMSTGYHHNLAVTTDGTLVAWGDSGFGQLGINSTNGSLSPVAVNTSSLGAGERFMALYSNKTIFQSLAIVARPPRPTVATLAATDIAASSATLQGRVNPNNGSVTLAFEYGISTTYGSSVAASPANASGSTPATASAAVANLISGATYHYRLVASTGGSAIYGPDRTFTTTDEAALASLSTTAGPPDQPFSADRLDYHLTVPGDVAQLSLAATPARPGSTVTFNGGSNPTVNLPVGSSTITIEVTAQGGSPSQTYRLVVTRVPQVFSFGSASTVGLRAAWLSPNAINVGFELGFEPLSGTRLTVIENTGTGFIKGRFANLAQGQFVTLNFGGRDYRFAANYYGGDGNDLVLEWATTRLFGWGTGATPGSRLPVAADPTGGILASPIVSIAGSPRHRLVLRADGTLQAWGENDTAALGNGTNTASYIPVFIDQSGVLAGKLIIAVSTHQNHALALCADGTVAGWGLNNSGVNGIQSENYVTRPVAIPVAQMNPGKAIRGIACGDRSNFAWFEDGTVVGWGSNVSGQLGNNSLFDSPVPVRVVANGALAGKKVVNVVTGSDFTLALCSDGSVAAWGENGTGQLGNGGTTDSRVPVAVTGGALAGKTVTSLASGSGNTYALCSDGSVVAWGNNNLNQLGGIFTGNFSSLPVAIDQTGVLAGKTVTSVAASEAHGWALCSDGSIAAWGFNSTGQLGDNTITHSPKPVLAKLDNLIAGERFTAVSSSKNGYASYALSALPQAPTLTTLAANPLGSTIATLRGEVLPDGLAGDLFFDYGVDSRYGFIAAATPATASGSAAIPAGAALSGLTPGSTWHYRLRLTTSHGHYYGEDRTLTTTLAATLAGLGTTAGPVQPAFDPLGTRYAISVSSATSSITLAPVTAVPGASVTVNGNPASVPVSLAPGANDLNVEVTAPGGGADRFRYLLVVTRFPETLRFTSPAQPLLSAREFTANGTLPPLELGFIPQPGTILKLVDNRGGNHIHGRFANLPHAGTVDLEAGGTAWRFVINYHGGDGNDLVLQWANSRLLGWGEGFRGQMGIGVVSDYHTSPIVAGLDYAMTGKKVLTPGAGTDASFVLNTDGSINAWGATIFIGTGGILGNGNTNGSYFPVPVTVTEALAGKDITAIHPGRNFQIAVLGDGRMAAWGSNNIGQLNFPEADFSILEPRLIPTTGALAGRRVTAVATGASFTLARCDDGALVAWGASDSGQLGNNNSSPTRITPPTLVTTAGALAGKYVTAIAAGVNHCLALCEDGSVVAWGFNDAGQLGDGSTTERWAPVVVTGGALTGKQVIAITAGDKHSLALCSDGTIAAWGLNTNGQLGDGSQKNSSIPVAVDQSGVLAGKSVLTISASPATSFAWCSDGTLASWGANDRGQAGDGSTSHRASPVAVSTLTLREGERLMSPPQRSTSRHNLTLGGVALGSATTLPATQIGGTRARLHGSVDPNRNEVTLGFEYGLDSTYGSQVAASPATASGINSAAFSAPIAGLKAGTTYHYRAIAEGAGGIVRGEDMTFTTLSDNALLGALGVTEGVLGPDFSPQVQTYHVSVPASTGSVTVNPVTDHPRATFEVGNSTLTGQRTTISITVTAEDRETTKTYRIIVTQLPETFVLGSDGPAPLVVDGFSARGYPARLALGEAPLPGSIFKVVDNTGLGFIHGNFSNLARGQRVTLIYDGLEYDFVANYHGGDGNDLVLQWAATRTFGWGQNTHGQVGDGTTTRRLIPTAANESGVLAGKTVIAISGGYLHSLALCSDGSVAAWGSSAQGQLGHGLTSTSTTPVAVDLSQVGAELIAISAGPFHNLGLRADGRIVAWGFNNNGQLGTGDKVTQLRPVLVPVAGALVGKQVIAVAAGTYQSFALCADGTVVAWGYNDEGELGDGSTVSTAVPVAVDVTGVLAGKQVAAIATGQYHTLARCTDGTLVAWGYNARGQLGTSTLNDAHSPVAVDVSGVIAGKTVVGLSAGEAHSAVLCSDGSVAAWGYNNRSQLGNGSTLASSVPVAVDFSGIPTGKTVTSLTAGRNHHVAHFSDGTLAAWGDNQQGQLGNNSTSVGIRPGLVNLTAPPAGSRAMFEASGSAAYHGLTVVGIPASRPVAQSAAQAAKIIGDQTDGDRDGISDVIELAFGLNRNADSSGQLPKPQLSGETYGFKFAAPTGVSGFLYGAEWSTTLEPDSWRDIPDTGSAGVHEFKLPTSSAPRFFMRLKAVPGYP